WATCVAAGGSQFASTATTEPLSGYGSSWALTPGMQTTCDLCAGRLRQTDVLSSGYPIVTQLDWNHLSQNAPRTGGFLILLVTIEKRVWFCMKAVFCTWTTPFCSRFS